MSKWKSLLEKWAKQTLNRPAEPTLNIPSENKRREFVVVGLGRFGTSLAETLFHHNHDVLAIDINEERVQHLSNKLPHVVQLDATNADSLHQIGIEQFHTGLVCISGNFEHNILASTLMLQFGVNRVITKARTHTQKMLPRLTS